MRRWSLKKILVTLIALCALAYVGEKGGKVEYFFNPPQPTPCVRALFPHESQPACWWLARHSDQQIFMN
jgi:hypothetical protein